MRLQRALTVPPQQSTNQDVIPVELASAEVKRLYGVDLNHPWIKGCYFLTGEGKTLYVWYEEPERRGLTPDHLEIPYERVEEEESMCDRRCSPPPHPRCS